MYYILNKILYASPNSQTALCPLYYVFDIILYSLLTITTLVLWWKRMLRYYFLTFTKSFIWYLRGCHYLIQQLFQFCCSFILFLELLKILVLIITFMTSIISLVFVIFPIPFISSLISVTFICHFAYSSNDDIFLDSL